MRNCELEFKLEDVLPKFSEELQQKILHSVELLRKAEKLALAYDAENGYYLAFSGGKDSQCLYHITKLAGVKFKAHMNLTSVDPADVIRFVKTEYPDVKLNKPVDSIFNMAVKKGILPTMRVRWCCAIYKETAGAGKVTLTGIRHKESARRAQRNEVEVNNHQYSGTLEGLSDYRKQRNKKRKPRKGTFSIINVEGEREIGCIRGKESLIVNPIIEWTENEVWTFLNVLGVKHCSLYEEGFHRIGCILCPMSQPRQKLAEIKRWPHVKRGWIRAIKSIRRGGVFANGYIWWNIPKDWTPLASEAYDPSRRLAMHIANKPESSLNGGGTFGKFRTKNGGQWPPDKGCRLRRNEDWISPRGFSDSASSDGLTEAQEDEIAENIFDWWISGKPYGKWYAEKFLQQDMFNDNKDKDNE